MKTYPYKHWCGEMIESKMDEFYHDCDSWEGEELDEKI